MPNTHGTPTPTLAPAIARFEALLHEAEHLATIETGQARQRDNGRGVEGWLTRGMQLYELLLAIAQRIAERLQGRQLANLKQNREGNISPSDESGRTKDLAAAKAGLGSGKTLEAAQKVVEHGTPELVAAMDEGIQRLETPNLGSPRDDPKLVHPQAEGEQLPETRQSGFLQWWKRDPSGCW